MRQSPTASKKWGRLVILAVGGEQHGVPHCTTAGTQKLAKSSLPQKGMGLYGGE
jgi:hypothetical protein